MSDCSNLDLPRWRRAFGRAFREARDAARTSQEQLALEIGVDRARVSESENAVHSPGFEHTLGLAHALDVSVAYLFLRAESLLAHGSRAAA